jgi:LVIVD repeat
MTSARLLSLSLALVSLAGCARSTTTSESNPSPSDRLATKPPSPDPRIGLEGGLMDAEEAAWNLRVLSKTPPPEEFQGVTNSDLAFTGNYAIQGNYNGWQVWDISNPRRPTLKTGYVCPASQSDVSVYKNLLFVSGENLAARLDCGIQGIEDSVSKDRLRGLRIFDISDIANPRNVGNVQTCRGSHTHSVLVDPKDKENVYVYISGSAPVRSPSELAGCISAMPSQDPNTAWFRIEVIKVPLANPAQAAVVSSPRIFEGLVAPPRHGDTREDSLAHAKMVEEAKARGELVVNVPGHGDIFIGREKAREMLDTMVARRGGTGEPTAQDSAALRAEIPRIVAAMDPQPDSTAGPTQCHDITVYPAIGLGGGACEGYGMLLDIRDPVNPRRIDAVSDPNFSYWHSATFNNEGNKILFSDEWGGGTQPKCRKTDKPEWGADALFTIENRRKMRFQGYYKLPAPQTPVENCVAHNGSLIPIPGRDIMVQAWYQGGISIFEWTDPKNPREIAFFDRGPVDPSRLESGGYWSAYWYNGVIVGSEMARGLDIFELVPSAFISQNEIEAAKSVRLEYQNVQGQQKLVWPASVSLAGAYLDQLERSKGLDAAKIAVIRESLASSEKAPGAESRKMLADLVRQLETEAARSGDPGKVRTLAGVVGQLAAGPSLARRQ